MSQWTSLIVALTVAACSKGGKEGSGGTEDGKLPFQSACDTREKQNTCVEYFGTGAGKDHCAGVGGKAIDRCPKDGALGRCVSKEIGIQQVLFYAPFTKEKAEVACKGMGDGKLEVP